MTLSSHPPTPDSAFIQPDPQDFEIVERGFGPLPLDAPQKEAAHRYRLAQATKILRLHGASAQQQTAGRHHYGEEPA